MRDEPIYDLLLLGKPDALAAFQIFERLIENCRHQWAATEVTVNAEVEKSAKLTPILSRGASGQMGKHTASTPLKAGASPHRLIARSYLRSVQI